MSEDAKKKAADDKAALEKTQAAQRQQATGKPTPTQEELDSVKPGEATKLEADGSTAPEVQPTSPEDLAKLQAEQRAKAAGKPTPTQEELDAANTGATGLTMHEPDGSTAPDAKDAAANKPAANHPNRAHPPAAQHQPAAQAPRGRATPAASE